jgi:4-hydroxybenzoate polyprenyltransferase
MNFLIQQTVRIRNLLEMIRFSHTLFALPFALVSAALAWTDKREFSWLDLMGILLCMVFARSAAMAFNRLADRYLDAANPRTAQRHLPSMQLTVGTVVVFNAICAAGFIASTSLFLIENNPWPLYLSGPILIFIYAYSFTKRFTFLSHFWLGMSLLLAPLGAWIAVRGMEHLTSPCLLGLAVLFWVAGFDILYACQDVDFDRAASLYSIPARFGVGVSLWIALGCHVVMVAMLIALWATCPYLGPIYLVGVGAVGLLLGYEHWLVRPNDLTRVNQAFFLVNGIISVGLLLVVLLQLAFLN